MTRSANGTMYGVALVATDGIWLLARIRRSSAGDVYYLITRPGPGWNVHASYHARGTTHIRSYEWKHFKTQRQRPDASFKGSETIFAQSFQPGEIALHRTPCVSTEFTDLFEIPETVVLPSEHYTLVTDLVEPGKDAVPGPWKEIVIQGTFRDAEPWIVITLWEGLAF